MNIKEKDSTSIRNKYKEKVIPEKSIKEKSEESKSSFKNNVNTKLKQGHVDSSNIYLRNNIVVNKYSNNEIMQYDKNNLYNNIGNYNNHEIKKVEYNYKEKTKDNNNYSIYEKKKPFLNENSKNPFRNKNQEIEKDFEKSRKAHNDNDYFNNDDITEINKNRTKYNVSNNNLLKRNAENYICNNNIYLYFIKLLFILLAIDVIYSKTSLEIILKRNKFSIVIIVILLFLFLLYLFKRKKNKDNEIYKLKEKEKENLSKINYFENIINNKDNEISTLKIKIEENISLLNERDNKIKNCENIIKNKEEELSALKIKYKENISLLNELNNKIKDFENTNNEYKEKINQLEKKIKENSSKNNTISGEKNINENKEKNNIEFKEKKVIKERSVEESLKIYGFRNSGNNCYINSSLQLLTRINEFKKGILSYEDNYEINKENDTKGKLFVEIKEIINKIENSNDNNLILNPENLKYVMGSIDAKYYRNFQEDANEFISYFISGLFKETATKAKVRDVKKLEMDNELDQKAYDNFYRRYYLKKGNSFLTEIFYGILKTRNYCKKCGETITNKFNAYNMLDLPIYKLVKKNKNKTLELDQILNEYRSEKKIEFICTNCGDNSEIYTETLLYTLPKYLILCFIRIIGDEYINNNIIYNNILNIKSDYDNKNYKYTLECVVEHTGGAHYGHYTALCPKDKINNKWYRFSDSYCNKYNNDFHSRDALILLYKS